MKTVGVCFGATHLQAVVLYSEPVLSAVQKSWRIPHEGDPRRAFLRLLDEIDLFEVDRIAVTGRHFRNSVALTSISEPQAVESGLKAVYTRPPFPEIVISSGGETQLVYRLDSKRRIASVHSGNKCASGTGEFFLQQVRRMELGLDEAVTLAQKGTPCNVAGRCSVFCKSDCTHALNKGEPRENIVAGLCRMMAEKLVDLAKARAGQRVCMIGGGTLNHAMTDYLRTRLKNFEIPPHAGVFEAYGAACWAVTHPCLPLSSVGRELFIPRKSSFGIHPSLHSFRSLVEFKQNQSDRVRPGDHCVVGLDVGSTTTKAVVVRSADKQIVGSVYLRTNGDPVTAAQNCYAELEKTVPHAKIDAVGVTGSGRQIAGLHALTDIIINEIIAHATAAVHYDSKVDTIFEIGGQDAKYTFLTGGVASDYAMNEACSAGTGSFLEEAAWESLRVKTTEIGEAALRGNVPPNFSDQCAAFISSDIKRASQEGAARDDILAGLVYSICLNYLNRVKGPRPVGETIFMQGGVCYNPAVPVAMAALMKTRIIVPPHPGLMGAFGVALETVRRIEKGEAAVSELDLSELAQRSARREGSFVCAGGSEKCDRKCRIARIRIHDQLYAFGGMCDRYYNQRIKRTVSAGELDFVAVRQELLFGKYFLKAPLHTAIKAHGKRVGIPRSFLVHSLLPLYSAFFSELGFTVEISDQIDPDGMARKEAEFCFPAEIAHGAFSNLLKKEVDYIFLPQVMQIPVPNVPTYSRACVFVQGETYYLQTTFRKEIEASGVTILAPVLVIGKEYLQARRQFCEMASRLGVQEKRADRAFVFACRHQRSFEKELRRHGKRALHYLETHPGQIGTVLFGRPYNAFSTDANMGIPHKVASRGTCIIPHEMLPADEYPVDRKMFWAMGQRIMKAAQFVKERKNLFGIYITNFSCGPDSFLLSYFRELMGDTPSLTLELDQHTADAGIDTRLEAALDIMNLYRRSQSEKTRISLARPFVPARIRGGLRFKVETSEGEILELSDPRVEVIIPSMGRFGAQALAAVLRSKGIRAQACPVPDKEVLLLGKKNTTAKECLPYIVITGSFLSHLSRKRERGKVTLLFMATGGGPCRLGQYRRGLEMLIRRKRLHNTAVLAMSDENGYGGLGSAKLLAGWQSIVVSDVFNEIRSLLRVAAVDPQEALAELEHCWQEVVAFFEGKLSLRLTTLLENICTRLARIRLTAEPSEIPVISLIGEIFVRTDEFSRGTIVDYLEQHGFRVKVAPVGEYLCYSNYVIHRGLGERTFSPAQTIKMRLTAHLQEWWERRIKTVMTGSGLFQYEMIEVDKTIEDIRHLLNPNFRGECILTVGLGLREIVDHSCGVISIGPFGCMPSRMAESILKKEMNIRGKQRLPHGYTRTAGLSPDTGLPFLAIETDGTPFPQITEANLEAFVLQARRLHKELRSRHNRKFKLAETAFFDVFSRA